MKKMLYWLWLVLPLPKKLRFFLMWLVNWKFVIGTAALITNEKGEILLFKHAYRKDFPWGFPGGYLKKGEDPIKALQREFMEESGLHIKILRLLEVIKSPQTSRLEVLFLGQLIDDDGFTPSIEVGEARFFSLNHMPELLDEHRGMIERHLMGD